MFTIIGQNSKGWKGKMRIPMFIKIGPEFQYLEGKAQNTNVRQDKVRIPKFINRPRIPRFRRITAEFQCLEV